MATDNRTASPSMNTILGKVTVKETGIGIPNVLVVLYDLDPNMHNDEGLAGNVIINPVHTTTTTAESPRVEADRIASVITQENGSWEVQYIDSEYRVLNANEKRPDYLLQVLAPEDADSNQPPRILFSSKMLRVNSARMESYLIRITEEQLKEAGVPLPTAEKADESTESKIARFRTKKTAAKQLREGLRNVNAELETAESTETLLLKDTFKKVILPNREMLNGMKNFVGEGKTIEEVHTTVIDDSTSVISTKIAPPTGQPEAGKGIKINLILTDDEKAGLSVFEVPINGVIHYNLPEAKVNEILSKRETDGGITSILFADNPISKFCMQHTTEEKCAKVHVGLGEDSAGTGTGPGAGHDHNGGSGAGSNGNGNNNTNGDLAGLTTGDINLLLQQVMPKDALHFHTNGETFKSNRPNSTSVQESVDKFALQKGPADATAFYDFHSLQIAFQHVWQQLLDETLVNLSERINTELENSGRKGILQQLKDQVTGITSHNISLLVSIIEEARLLFPEEIPADISVAFDISFPEYDALTADNKTRLLELAKEVNKYEIKSTLEPRGPQGGVSVTIAGQPPNTTPPTNHYHAARASVLRDQGERIIDNVRINKPFSTNQLLKELQDRILSKYEFTVFAANKDYHSVNFGLLNTYRQKWEPISYQAGKLVKTIPLSPKEERKYSVKTTQNIKISRKEARKNNSSLHQEINTTSRAESEIVAKAHDKSNFNMSVKLDYSKIKSEVGFTKDAEKDSSQSKKDFREAVIKAAQEFREERSLEIDTEETLGSEYTESGTILNPNDELSVAYLFYELQRRYRVSEQLYRVMPVVMVAQEVPAPGQITEAWIIAHDWILNRALLDDSFRPTLQYIAQKNVGDDFAIRELRKNLRAQRTLVNNLQLEFAKLKTLVDNKYAMLQGTISERIDEEHQKRFLKWWWWWGREKADSPPDPEMAKAMEQAAAEDHKHAVEQAERLALSVQREVNVLHQLTMEYNAVMREHLDRITQTRRLITHIKENILYYMQAIWSMEPPDQRFMRMYKVNVPVFEAERTLLIDGREQPDVFSQFRAAGKKKYQGWLHANVKRKTDGTPDVRFKQLVEIADLDSVLGFKGNYMIFPMKEHNALTKLMAAPYVDEAFGAMDPDELSNVNLADFSKYICCLHNENPAEYNRLKDVLKAWLEKLLADPLRNGDEIIVPTGSLFIEMLPSDKSLLEDFKLQHRQWDVYKVQADVRRMELENIRYAARLLNEERGDPDTEKKVIIPEGQIILEQ